MCAYESVSDNCQTVGRQLKCAGGITIDDRIWVVGGFEMANAVFSMNKDLMDVRLEYSITEQENQDIYAIIKQKENHIYLFPWLATSIIDIDIVSGVQKRHKLNPILHEGEKYGVIDAIEYQGKFYLIPFDIMHPFIRFDGSTVEECLGWKEQVQAAAMRKSGILSYQVQLVDDKLYALLYGSDKILCFDLNTWRMSTYNLPWQSHDFERLEYHKGKFWLIPGGKGKMLSFSFENGVEGCYSIPDTFPTCKECTFSFSYLYDHFIWFTPWMADEILILDLNTGNFESLKFPEELQNDTVPPGLSKVDYGFVEDNYLRLFAWGGKYHCVIDMQTQKFVGIVESRIKEEDYKKNLKVALTTQNIISISQGTLADFASVVGHNDVRNTMLVDNCGEKIWETLKGL